MFLAVPALYPRGLSELSAKTAANILEFFDDKYNVKTAIIRYDNISGASDLVAQKFYQLIVAKLENAKTLTGSFQYTDLMINFSKNQGQFNLNRVHSLNYLVYLKLTRNKNKIGAGVSIFSRISDKIVYIRYAESVFDVQEQDIFETSRFGFQDAGFSKLVEIDAKAGLLDFKSFQDHQGKLRFLFFYPGEVQFFSEQRNRLERYFSYPLKWDGTYYPVMAEEGKMAVFNGGDRFYITLGANFSRYAKVLELIGADCTEGGTIDFIPFRRIGINDEDYLVGARFSLGKNYFEQLLLLAPFAHLTTGRLSQDKESYPFLLKEVYPFYALDFSTVGEARTLDSLHLIDRDYKYRYFGDNFQQLTVEEAGNRGASLCAFNGVWLAVSDYSRGYDTLYFYKIEKGSRALVFQNSIAGEILLISEGMWKAARGFWLYVKMQKSPGATPEFKLQFWSKKSE
jgi:hypothetical protein